MRPTPTHARGSVSTDNFVVPFFGHCITVTQGPSSSSGSGSYVGTRRVSVYGTGEANYFYQLRRFADDVLALRGDDKARAAAAVEAMEADAADAIANMALVDAIYAASGLRQRAPTDPWY